MRLHHKHYECIAACGIGHLVPLVGLLEVQHLAGANIAHTKQRQNVQTNLTLNGTVTLDTRTFR